MAVVCLMIQNLIDFHAPKLEITQSSKSLPVSFNAESVDIDLIPKEYLIISE